ncbi:MAG: Ig-like domain-containing protein [Verrucomicrobia bacterium]|nr:Ig-like domain-containing protein [Verrucomicrobiota bacterium]
MRSSLNSPPLTGGRRSRLAPLIWGGLAAVSWMTAIQAADQFVANKVRFEFFNNIPGGSVNDLRNSPKFPGSPDLVTAEDAVAWNGPGDSYNNYGLRVSGYITPDVTGSYTFAISSDDNGEFWLSTDESAANLKRLAVEPQWNGFKQFAQGEFNADRTPNTGRNEADPENISDAVTLQANTKYYFEALMKEGGGGDNLAVAYQPAGTAFSNGQEALGEGGVLKVGANLPTVPTVFVQPKNAANYSGLSATFSVGAFLPEGGTIQWLLDGAPIAGATESTYTRTLLLSDNGKKIKARLTGGGTTVDSAEASVTVVETKPEVPSPGFAKIEFFTGITGTAVSALTDSEKFINNTPDVVSLIPGLDTPNGWGDNYGARVSGWITPTTTGNYTFFIRSDDASELWLSSGADPANATLIAEETGCCDAFKEPGEPETSSAIALTAGTRYAFYALLKEGGGGDYLQVAWRLENDNPTPVGSLVPIAGSVLSTTAQPLGHTLDIVQQPVPVTQQENRSATFTVGATATSLQVPPNTIAYQWQVNGVDIPGANRATLSFSKLALADNGKKYRVICTTVAGITKTSDEVLLTVVPDTFAPVPAVGAINKGATQEIGITFDEEVQSATASPQANYSLTGGTVTGFRYLTRPTTGFATAVPTYSGVVLTATGLTPGQTYTVNVKNVTDLKGNAIPAAGVNVSFKAAAAGITWGEIGANEAGAGFPADAVAVGENGFDVFSGGVADWNTYNEGTFVYEPVTGDFDKKVQVIYQDPSSNWARIGMSAREGLDLGKARPPSEPSEAEKFARHQSVHNPNPVRFDGAASNKIFEANRRLVRGGATDSLPGGGTPNFPNNVWLRIKREGNVIRVFNSEDGVVWNEQGTGTDFGAARDNDLNPDTENDSLPLPATMYVGPWVAPELGNNDAQAGIGHSILAQFRNYGNVATVPVDPGTVTVTLNANGTVTLTWDAAKGGVLNSATSLNGAFAPVAGATGGSYTIPAGSLGSATFYVLKN